LERRFRIGPTGTSALLLAGLALSGPESLQAQLPLTRASPMREVTFSRVAAMGDPHGPGFIGIPADAARRHNGEWVVTDQDNPSEVKFYSQDGAWIRTLGRQGAGPGEFGQAWSIQVTEEDGLRIFDAGLGRIAGFGPDLKPTGTTPVRVSATSLAFLPSGQAIVGARLHGPSQVGLPLHLLDSLGSVVRSFGADPPIREWGNPSKVRRTLAPSRAGGVWSGERTRYAIEHWTAAGERTHGFFAEVPWFRPHEGFGRRDSSNTPNPTIYAIHEDADGMLWLAIRVPAEDWRDAYRAGRDPYGRETSVVDDENALYDTVVEVIDPARGRVVATGRHPLAAWGFTRCGRLIFHRYLPDMTSRVEIWETGIRRLVARRISDSSSRGIWSSSGAAAGIR
jgi:hypothetical protein